MNFLSIGIIRRSIFFVFFVIFNFSNVIIRVWVNGIWWIIIVRVVWFWFYFSIKIVFENSNNLLNFLRFVINRGFVDFVWCNNFNFRYDIIRVCVNGIWWISIVGIIWFWLYINIVWIVWYCFWISIVGIIIFVVCIFKYFVVYIWEYW